MFDIGLESVCKISNERFCSCDNDFFLSHRVYYDHESGFFLYFESNDPGAVLRQVSVVCF